MTVITASARSVLHNDCPFRLEGKNRIDVNAVRGLLLLQHHLTFHYLGYLNHTICKLVPSPLHIVVVSFSSQKMPVRA